MSDKNLKDEPFYGINKRSNNNSLFTYEVWENFTPNKLVGGEKLKYFPDILSNEQLEILIPFWKEIGTELNDPILSLQIDKNGGATILYRYSDNREGAPPNARCGIIKPIMEKGVEKMILADSSRSTFILHTSINSPSLKDDIIDFLSILKKDSLNDDELKENNIQEEIFSNTFILDRRINK